MSEAVDVDQVPSPPRLPTFGMKDGDQIIDGNGNIFEYNSEQDEWVYHGQIEVPDIVTLDQDGLVYPEVYRKLVLIQELIDRGIDFGLFKLDTPGMTPYYYYFYSSDDLIRFYPETNSRLRLEVDRNRIYQKLLRSCCAGPVGQQGEQGAAGRDGIPASNESFHFPTSVTAGEFEFDTTVATPIDTQISLRLFRDDQILVEYLLQIAGGTGVITVNASGDQVLTDEQKQAAELESEARGLFEEGRINEAIDKLEEVVELEVDVERVQAIIDSLEADGTWPEDPSKLDIIIYDDVIDIDYTGTEINFDRSEDRIWGTLAFTSGASDLADWKYKVRQRGPKGASGQDGSAFLEISEQVLDDPTVRSNAAIVTTRKSDLTNTITYLSNDLPDDVCVSNLALSAGALPVGDILEAKFLAAKVTTRSCKDIGSYQYSPPEYEAPPLELPAWEPTQDCVTAARFSSYKFEWWDLTDPKYPYRIVTPPRPNDQCCQEPFFWCPNVGDNPCIAEGSLIHTDNGLIPIEKLSVGSNVMCPDGQFRPLDAFYDNGIRECVKITFTDGSEIICTPDHKFPVGGQQIEAKDLKLFDQIHKAHGALEWLKEHRNGTDEDFDRGYSIGYLLGDGWISDCSVGIGAPEADGEGFNRAYEILCKKLGRNKITKSKTNNGIIMFKAEWKSISARESFCGWYKNLQHHDGPKVNIPNSIYTESLKFYQGFLSALINSDGCINKRSEINVISSCTETLPKTCKRILDYLGISSNFKTHSDNGNFSKPEALTYRVDIHSGSNHTIKKLLAEGLIERKIGNLINLPSSEPIGWVQPELRYDIRETKEYKSGLIAGAFTYNGGYNNETGRAWVNKMMPVDLRGELGIELPKGKHYIRNARDRIGKHIDENLVCRDYAVGFLRGAIYHRDRLRPDKSFIIFRTDKQEFDLTCKCLDMLEIDYRVGDKQVRDNYRQCHEAILYGHAIYKLLMLTGFRERIGDLQPRLPTAGNGVVSVQSVKEVGGRHVYNYKVPPYHIIAAEGNYCLNCGVNHWRCGGIEKLPSGAANAQGLSCNGEPREPILKPPAPKAPECDCDCDSPLAFELQNGGFSLGTIELGPPPTYIDAYSNSEPSVIDGRTDTFKANFKASGQIDVSVNLEWNSAVCGGEKEKENCQYQENCEVHTTIVFEDNNKNADISGGGVAELSTLPGSASFTVRPLAGSDIDVVINVMVNDTRSQCCRGYEIRLAAAYTDADAFSGGTPDVEVVDGNWVPL